MLKNAVPAESGMAFALLRRTETGRILLTMESPRALSLAQDLMRALRTRSGTREDWLVPLLRAVMDATAAEIAWLGEPAPQGWVRTALLPQGLTVRVEPRLLGLTRRLMARGGTLLEPVLHRGTPFRVRTDGWDGITAGGFAGARIPETTERRSWLSILRTPAGPRFETGTVALLTLAAEAAATALANETRFKQLEKLAMTDGLTHIPNYRFLRQAVEAEINRALRSEGFFTVVMVDVDNLKKYNGVHGHLAGSEVLRRLARILRENVRRSDVAAKYGGDEFLLILPQTRPEGGVALSERLRRRIGEHLRGCAGELLSCSFGVAGFPEDGCDFESLIAAADRALFRAKNEGRNAVVCLAERAEREVDAAA
jgi:diguanylate cyclase (GGDEF)-like protein